MKKQIYRQLLSFICIAVLLSLSLNAVVFAEPVPANNDMDHATNIESNTLFFEKIETSTDRDFYTFTLNSPSSVSFLLGLPSVVNYDVNLYRGSKLIYSCNSSSNNRTESFDLSLGSGIYYLEIFGVNSSYSATKFYGVELVTYSSSDSMEPNNDFAQASNLLNINGSLDATIQNSTDKDYYKFNVAKASRFEFNMTVPTNTNYDVILYNSTHTVVLKSEAGSGYPEKMLINNLPAGTYYISVYGYNGSYSTKTYSMNASLIAIDKPVRSQSSYISIDNANSRPGVGGILEVNINIKNIPGFAGYQTCITYDPAVLVPVNPLTMENKVAIDDVNDRTPLNMVSNGDILIKRYSPIYMESFDSLKGELLVGKTYMNLSAYKASNTAESSGTIGVICFKVLSTNPTSINFTDSPVLRHPVNGTMIFDWDGGQLINYSTYNLTLN